MAPEGGGASVPLPPKRAAIVHDWFSGLFGSERVVEAMRAGLFDPAALPDVFTFHAAHELLPPGLSAAIKRESRVAALPGLRQRGHSPGRWRYLLPYMPAYFSRLDLDPYELVVVSSHSCAVNARPREDALYVCYCHTPMRYVWMPELDRNRVRGARGAGLRAVGGYLRRRDREAAQRPDVIVANSSAVRERIRDFWDRDAEVIPPPVDVAALDPAAEKEPGHFLWVHRLVDYKRPELVMEAFRELPYRLTMVGVGPLESRLRERLPANVELRGWIAQEELDALYERASGFIHVGEEDFGISIVEALAAGVPVIAAARGGAPDIVRPGEDGLLVAEPDVASIRAAVRELAEREWDREALARRAAEFSRERFLERMADLIRSLG